MNAIARKIIMEEILIVLRITFFAKMCLKIDAKIQLIKNFTFARLIQIISQLKIANNILSAMIPFLGKSFFGRLTNSGNS